MANVSVMSNKNCLDKMVILYTTSCNLTLISSRKDVKQLVYFQILQNADNIFFTQ